MKNEYQGPEWAMEIIDDRDLAIVSVGHGRYEIHRRRGASTEAIGVGWFDSAQVECYLIGYNDAMREAATEKNRGEGGARPCSKISSRGDDL